MSNAFITLSLMLAYFILNVIIMKIAGRKQDSLEEYSVGSRSFGFALTVFAYMGAIYPGAVYVAWFSNSMTLGVSAQYIIIYCAGSSAVMYFMARPVWIWGKVYNLESQGDFVAKRYGSNKFRFIFMLVLFFVYSPWLVVEVKAIGYIMQAATYYSIGFNLAILIACGFVIGYSFLGGIRATAITGLVQGITIGVVGVIAIYYLIVKAYGGLTELYSIAEYFKPELLLITNIGGGTAFWASIIIVATVGVWVLPAIFIRLYIVDSPMTTKKSVLVAPYLGIIMGFVILALGLGGLSFSDFPADSQQAIFWLADKFGGPVFLGIIGILGLAASMSSIAVFLNCFAVMISKDLIGAIKPGIDRKTLFKLSRLFTVIMGLTAMAIATLDLSNLMFLIIKIYDSCVQAFPLIILGMYWRRANLQGAVSGFILGSVIAVVGNFVPQTIAWAGGWTAGMIGLWFNFGALIICGLIFKKQEHVDEMFDLLETYKEPLPKSII